ncbi:MAG: hypothetical protein EOP34_02550 [Rickettsiales bacterium]|nr:MAG: hypothetical protein EOP34_02550 [Rickettsiales bacterium]
MPSFKTVNNVVRYSLFDIKIRHLKLYNIPINSIILLKKLFRLQETHFDYTKVINFNLSKYNGLNLKSRNLGLISLIEKLYSKKVLFNIIELKSIHLNSDVFSSAVALKLRYRYAGSLKNIRSSFNNKSSTMLRGYVKSNSQYTLINSKTRNGTFGLKG